MAIDDNTLYGLTGAQVKELPEKIEAIKGLARELTEADYNFHTSGDTDNRIALWLLPSGIYCWNRDLNQNILLTRDKSVAFSGNGMGAIVMDGHSYKPILLFNEMSQGFGLNYWGIGNGGYYGDGKWVSFSLVDNLTTDHGYEALSAKQGKVLKDLIDSIAIRGAGAPTTSTVGTVGQLYQDTTNGDLYICTAVSGSTYTWTEIGAGGGGGPTVVQTTGTSTTDVMSQKATTSMVFADPATKYNINIGGAGNPANGGAVLLHGTSSYQNAIAIGVGSSAQATGGIALGAGAKATSTGEMNIGTPWASNGYNSSNYRLLTGLYDPQSAHDAATKGYVDSIAPTITMTTTDPGEGVPLAANQFIGVYE